MNLRVSTISSLAATLVLLAIPRAATALDPARTLWQYSYQSWNRNNGLPANSIGCITQTRDGYLWLGTSMGLVRFDGIQFTALDLPDENQFRSKYIVALDAGRDGCLWFGLRDGSFGSYREGDGFHSYEKETWVKFWMGVTSVREASDGTLWVGTGAGIRRRTPSSPVAQEFNEAPMAFTLEEDRQGNIWAGTAANGIFRWNGSRMESLASLLPANTKVNDLALDPSGGLWVATQVGLCRYDASLKEQELDISHVEAKVVIVDRHGVLWVGTTGEGLWRCKDGQFTSFRKADGLADDTVTALFEDNEGSLWVGTRNGLTQFSDVKLPTFTYREGIVSGMCHDVCAAASGGLWIASSQGLCYMDGTNLWNIGLESGLRSPYCKLVHEARDGNLYVVGGAMDIAVLSGGKVIACHSESTWPTALVEDNEGVVAAVGGDLFRVGREKLVPFVYRDKPPPLYWIRSLAPCRDGAILAATVNGVFRIKDGRWRQWGTQDGLASQEARWVHEEPDGALWVGMPTAIARIKDDKIKNITREDGLFDMTAAAFIPDATWYWMNSTHGIFRATRRNLNDFADGKAARVECQGFDGPDSVKMADLTEVEYGAGCRTADGRVWFPNPEGVVMMDSAHLPVNRVAPPAHITRVRVNGREQASRTVTMPPRDSGELEIEYTAAGYVAPHRVQFRYQLEGYDADWVDAGTRRSAFYTNLKPGRYRFRVQACNADGFWGAVEEGLQLQLLPRFYQERWFLPAVILLTVAGAAGIYLWRVRVLRRNHRRLQEMNELLESKVAERTAELESNHRELLKASRLAGMAEVATSVLHNVGNVLNSVNVSAGLVEQKIKQSGLANLGRVQALLHEHQDDLAGFLTHDRRGKQLVGYLDRLIEHLTTEHEQVLGELNHLGRNVEHIKEIVAMQQSYARVSGVTEEVDVSALAEDALRMHMAGCERRHIVIIREFSPVPPATLDRHRVIQILVNLLQNAVRACEESPSHHRAITLRILQQNPKTILIQVADNGIGIPHENLTRIFGHGFTTRKQGHGFGLHSGALAAREMGGSLSVASDGVNCGATFTLELPVAPQLESKIESREAKA
ncbi:MAG: two-component regulator propeller domain-containing protein [Verrucomicrobiota bacterium]